VHNYVAEKVQHVSLKKM